MKSRKQNTEDRRQKPITKDEWVDLSRKLIERARSGFSSSELAVIAGFINYVADDVEGVQRTPASGACLSPLLDSRGYDEVMAERHGSVLR